MAWQSVQPFSINSTALSVTSFQFNPFNAPSEWVNNLFGTQAHFIPRKSLHSLKILGNSFDYS